LLTDEQQSVLGKYPALCAKLSLIFELVIQAECAIKNQCGRQEPQLIVSLQALQMSKKWIALLYSHNRRILQYCQTYQNDEKSDLLLPRLEKVGKEPFCARDVYRGAPVGLKTVAEFEKASAILVERGLLKKFILKSENNKNQAWYFRHPSLRIK
jgi:hypothetical protein